LRGLLQLRARRARNAHPEHEARLELTRVGFAQLPEISEPPRARSLRHRRAPTGQPARVSGTGRDPVGRDGDRDGAAGRDHPESEILKIEQRVFSKQKSSVVFLGGIGAVIGIAAAFGSGGPPVGQEPDKPPDEEAGSAPPGFAISLPILSFIFR
jgi:hypothetical protein